MATITLTANTNYSALTVANGDTINCAGYRLTINTQPAQTSVSVNSPGTAGKVTISGAYDLSTWSFTAGTSPLVDGSAPAGCTIGTATAGSVGGTAAVHNNYGVINTAIGGAITNAFGVNNNYGHIGTAIGSGTSGTAACNVNYSTISQSTGGAANNSYGCRTNYGSIQSCNGSSTTYGHGCLYNYGTIDLCTGGSATYAKGCYYNYGTLASCNGGTAGNAHGCHENYGNILSASDSTELAVLSFRGSVKFVSGPTFQSEIVTDANYDPLETLYVLDGPLHASAVVPSGVTVVNLFGQSALNMSGGFQ